MGAFCHASVAHTFCDVCVAIAFCDVYVAIVFCDICVVISFWGVRVAEVIFIVVFIEFGKDPLVICDVISRIY